VTARCFLARTLVEVGHFRQAAMRAEEAMTLSKGSEEAFGLAHACWVLGLTHLRLGGLDRAISVLERGFGVVQANALSFLSPILGSHLGYARALAGRIQDGWPSSSRRLKKPGVLDERESLLGLRRCWRRSISRAGARPTPP